jgi:hypothetical protein
LATATHYSLQRTNHLHEDIPIYAEKSHLSEGLDTGLSRHIFKQGDFPEVVALLVGVDHFVEALHNFVGDQLSLGHDVEAVADLSLLYDEFLGGEAAFFEVFEELGALVDVQILKELYFLDEGLALVHLVDHLAA